MKIQAAPPEHYDWIVERTGCRPSKDFRAIEAVSSSGSIRGMIGYDAWTVSSCQAHVAIEHPIVARELVGPAFQYPFLEGGRELIIAIIPDHNQRSIGTAKRLGFREKYRICDGFARDCDLVILEMRKLGCPWLTHSFGRKNG